MLTPRVALCAQEALARMQRVVAAVESRVAVQAPVAAIEAAAAAVLRGDGASATFTRCLPRAKTRVQSWTTPSVPVVLSALTAM